MKHWHWYFRNRVEDGYPSAHEHKNGHKHHEHRSKALVGYSRTSSGVRKQAEKYLKRKSRK